MEDEYKPTEAYQALLDYYGEYAPDIIKANGDPKAIKKVLAYKSGLNLGDPYTMGRKLGNAISNENINSGNAGYAQKQDGDYQTYTLGGVRPDGTKYAYNLAYRMRNGEPEYHPVNKSTYQEGEPLSDAQELAHPFKFYDDYMAHLNYNKVAPGIYQNKDGHYVINNLSHKAILDAEKAARAEYEKKKADAKAAQASQPTAQAEPSPALQNLRGMTANRVAKNNLA